MDIETTSMMLAAIPRLTAEEQSASLELSNYASFTKETQRSILKRIERLTPRQISPEEVWRLGK